MLTNAHRATLKTAEEFDHRRNSVPGKHTNALSSLKATVLTIAARRAALVLHAAPAICW